MDLPGPVVFFDGDCALCHWSVRVVARHDRAGRVHFAPLAGHTASRVLAGTILSGTVVLVDDDGVWTRSSAVLRLGRGLGGWWRVASVVAGVVPRALRDVAYDVVARFRYRVFGRTTCELLPAEVRARLLP